MGSPVPSEDIRNCELLTDALLFREEIQHTRDGRNRYKLFFLTDLGMEMAQQLEEEGFKGELPETPPITFNSD